MPEWLNGGHKHFNNLQKVLPELLVVIDYTADYGRDFVTHCMKSRLILKIKNLDQGIVGWALSQNPVIINLRKHEMS